MLISFFFHHRDVNITAVDIDPSMLTVATDYFGLVQDNRLKVVIDDGIKFLKKAVKNGTDFFLDCCPTSEITLFFLHRAIIQSNSI